MDLEHLQHKLIFGKYRMIYLYAFFGFTAAAIIGGILLPNLVIVLGACAFTALILFIVDISNVKRFGRYYGIDIIDNQLLKYPKKVGLGLSDRKTLLRLFNQRT